MKPNKTFLIFIFIVNLVLIKSQTTPSIAPSLPSSPQAESILRFGNYAINYSTGIPNVSIPLFEINHRGFQLAMDLQYSPQPLKPGYNYDVFGFGWGLSLNSCVSRTIEFLPDEERDFKLENPSLFWYPQTQWSTSYIWEKNYAHDKFSATLPNGSSFSFIIDRNVDDNSLKYIIDNGRKVIISCVHNSSNIQSFEIIDENGVKYTFSQGDIPHSLNIGDNRTRYVSWVISRIDLPDSSQPIYFNYEKMIETSGLMTEEPKVLIKSHTLLLPTPDEPSVYSADLLIDQMPSNYRMKLLTSIIYGDYQIILNYVNQNQTERFNYIKDIKILQQSSVLKNINPKMQMTQVGSVPLAQLKYVEIKGENINDNPLKYECTYNDISVSGATDHWGYLTNNSETNRVNANFNFYLGWTVSSDYTTSIINNSNFLSIVNKKPDDTCPMSKIKLARPNTIYRQPTSPSTHGILNSIKYPTGGYTEFLFENHEFLTSTDQNGDYILNPLNRVRATAAGFRINMLSNFDGNGSLINKKTFRYGPTYPNSNNHTGLGEPIADPNILTYMNFTSYNVFISMKNIVLGLQPDNVTPFSGLHPLSTSDYVTLQSPWGWECTFSALNFRALLDGRSPVLYPEITVYEGSPFDYDSNCEGKTVYKYKILADEPNYNLIGNNVQKRTIESPQYYGNALSYEGRKYLYNKLMEKTDYKYENNIFYIVKKELNEWYDNVYGYWKDYIYTNKFPNGYFPQNIGSNISSLFIDKNSKMGISQLNRKTTTIYYSANDSITSSESYSYNSRNQITNKTVTTSENKIVKNNFKYPELDINGNAPEVIKKLVNKNIISPVLTDSICVQDVQNESLISGISSKKIEYSEFSFGNTTILKPAKAYKLEIVPNGSVYNLEEEIIKYSIKGNPLETVSKSGIHTCFIWGYNDEYLVASIKNATYNYNGDIVGGADTFLKSEIDVITASWINIQTKLNELVIKLKSSFVTTYTYKPLVGVTSMTDPRGVTTTYEYDDFNRLKSVKDKDGNLLQQFNYHYNGQP